MQMFFFYSLTVKINCFLPLVLVSDCLPLSLLQVGIASQTNYMVNQC